MVIRSITEDDLDAVADLHLSSYHADHFTSRMPKKLLRTYYREIVQLNPFSYIALSGDGAQPLGFVIGGPRTKDGKNAFLIRNLVGVLSAAVRNPTFLVRWALNLVRRSQRRDSNVPFRLLSIAVSPDSQAKGTGHALLQHFEQTLISRGIRQYGLSVHATNAKAIQFYEKHDFRLEFDTGTAKYYLRTLHPSETLRT